MVKFIYAIIENNNEIYFRIENDNKLYKRKIINNYILWNKKYYLVRNIIASLKYDIDYNDVVSSKSIDGNINNYSYSNIEVDIIKPKALNKFRNEFDTIKLKDIDFI